MIVSGKFVDVINRTIYPAEVVFNNGIIERIGRLNSAPDHYIMPGLIDAHIHIESSMVTPGSFAIAAVSRGTTAVVTDPHEIANVLGIEGVMFMLDDSKKVPLKFFFGAPSCVPATPFESAGAVLDNDSLSRLLSLNEIKYLSEMMNYPGVINSNPEVIKKLKTAQRFNKPIDGHAPGVRGEALKKYVSAGISTDHECTTIEEAREKISLGMKILIREGSAARNLDALKDLIRTDPENVMLCSDDLHPEMLIKRHLDKLILKLVSEGFDLFDVLRSCSINTARHYNLETGSLEPGKPADIVIVDDINKMNVKETWIDGKKVFDNGRVLFDYKGAAHLNRFICSEITPKDLEVVARGNKMRVINAFDGDLMTKATLADVIKGKIIDADINSDLLKIVVKDRYGDSPPAVGFIKGFGLKSGAFASSVAHDSHNIISIGTNDRDIAAAVNEIVRMKGGLATAENNLIRSMALPVAGIISDAPVNVVAKEYENLSERVRSGGCIMSAPFMTLSFMALLVIPELKLSDKGLFDGNSFSLVPLFED